VGDRASRVLIVRASLACLLAGAVGLGCALLAPDAGADPLRRLEVKQPFEEDAGRDAGSFVLTSTPPDPRAMVEKEQWVFDLKYRQGEIFLQGVTRTELPGPQRTPRAMGRFALELFEGPTLIERVRFDFPMLADAQDGGWNMPPSMTGKLTTRIGVMFPATKRGTRLELKDRANGSRWGLPWPPREEIRSDAGPSLDAQSSGG
jgi:hypothetical protein